ncbi:DUF308 domain-containing protein [Croceibacterium sp. LX-88]|jgi:uncharacterized membrane protein HdeD (DUF308 family)|uniref:DUF308 domain-containing protein n=1 Tax=Croceibacterium selenioxidans TaxID=2838833 RepID=A0ABS5W4C5_9SPHN|nr:DUF308 domain-containing protein [Croceibacterium selenioxidans]MBT2134598.1 DUF308 domain-containing protein [Croceibacterium selenioxidans]
MNTATEAADTAPNAPNKRMGTSILMGIVFIIAGTLAILSPLAATWALTIIVGASLIVSGIARIIHAFSKSWGSFFLHLLLGLLYVGGGLGFWFAPVSAAILLTVLLAWLLILQGIGEIWLAFTAKPARAWGWVLVAGVITLACGVWLVFRLPSLGVFMPGIFLGVSLIIEGWASLLMRRP